MNELDQKEKELLEIYNRIYETMDDLAGDGHTVMSIATALLTTALRMYRTSLPDEDYNQFIDYVSERRDMIDKFQFQDRSKLN